MTFLGQLEKLDWILNIGQDIKYYRIEYYRMWTGYKHYKTIFILDNSIVYMQENNPIIKVMHANVYRSKLYLLLTFKWFYQNLDIERDKENMVNC